MLASISIPRVDSRKAKDVLRLETDKETRVKIHEVPQGRAKKGIKEPMKVE